MVRSFGNYDQEFWSLPGTNNILRAEIHCELHIALFPNTGIYDQGFFFFFGHTAGLISSQVGLLHGSFTLSFTLEGSHQGDPSGYHENLTLVKKRKKEVGIIWKSLNITMQF